ncbi:L-serine ammonia-lyase, iron-sulfur-dependent, subunit alpha [Candidatus Peregrinibacteria bacterium]|nr:MAG: L-serine ammonia-lyase, iron-sulfur-dependent, subunit alpha [Candidatus Peregrinibacteria bacterium]
MFQFKNCEELLKLCAEQKTDISQIAIKYEMEISGKSRAKVRDKMKQVRDTMWEAIQTGIKATDKSQYGLVGGDAKKVYDGTKNMANLLGSKVGVRAMAYALATNEQNARMGKIVAFPTAGGSGVVPGVLFSTFEHMKSSKRKMLNALFAASALGIAILEHGGTFSAAKAGCQAEVGIGTAMAAAGVTEMRGGTPEQCINAAALALKNMLGLACDPLGGLVEVPCVKRNAIYVNVALGASDLSLLGVVSVIPMDQVVEAMMNISAHMSETIRETALGGLAVTKKGLELRKKMGLPPIPEKYLNRKIGAAPACRNKCNGCG